MERSGGRESHHDQSGRPETTDKVKPGSRQQGQTSSSRSHEVISPKPVPNSQTSGNRLEVYKVDKKRSRSDAEKRASHPRPVNKVIDPAVLPKLPGASSLNFTQLVDTAKNQKASSNQKPQAKTTQGAETPKIAKSQKVAKPQIKITQVTDAALKKAKKAEDAKKSLLKGSQKVEDSNSSKPKVSKTDESSKSKPKTSKKGEDSNIQKQEKKEITKPNELPIQAVHIENETSRSENSNSKKSQTPSAVSVPVSETTQIPATKQYEFPNSKVEEAARTSESPVTKQPQASAASPTRVMFKVGKPGRPEEVHIDMSALSRNPQSVHSTAEGYQRHFVRLGFPSAPFRRIVHVTSKSLCLSCLATFFLLLASLLLFGPVVILVAIVVPVCVIVKKICDICCCCRFCDHCCSFCCNESVSSSESMWLDKTNTNACVVQSLIVLQAGLDTERIRDLINSRVISAEDRRGNRLYPRFTEKVVPFCCGYSWVQDYHFFINNHVFNATVRLSSLEDLQEYISEMASKPLPEDHPLWEIQVYHNFGPQRDTALLFRMHPCMTDGVSMIRILQEAVVDSQAVATPGYPVSSGPAFLGTFRAFFFGPLTFCCKYLCLRDDFNMLHGRHVHPSGDMVVAWSAPFSMRSATRIKQVSRCTMSELLMSVAAGNVRSYLQVSGIINPFDMQCAIPFDFRETDPRHKSEMRSKYSFVVLPLPTNTEGAIPRLWEMKMTMEEFKRSPEAAVIKGAKWFTSATLPKSLYSKLWNSIYSKCTCLISNLAGPETTLRFASREIKCVMYWLPPLDKVAVAISFLTYGDQIRMAVIADRSVLPNPELLTKDFIFQMDMLSKLLAHRRIPGEQICRRMENMHLLSSYSISDLSVEQIQLQMSLVQQELHDLKLQLESQSARKFSHNEAHAMKKIENLKEQFRELMVELRKKRASENENAVVLTSDDTDDEMDIDRPQRPFRRRTLSMSSRMSTASVSSTIRPLSTAPPSGQPSPTHPGLPSWPGPEIELKDVERALMKKHAGYKQRLSTMEEYDMDDGAQGIDERRYRTY